MFYLLYLVLRSNYFRETGDFDSALKYSRLAVDYVKQNCKSNALKHFPTELLEAVSVLELAYIMQGKVNKKMKIYNNNNRKKKGKPELIEQVEKDELLSLLKPDLSIEHFNYYWHLWNVALNFSSYEYNEHAEKNFKRIIDTFKSTFENMQQKQSPSEYDQAVFNLFTQTQNDLSVFYYNNGKKNEYWDLQKNLSEIVINTSSKYTRTYNAKIIPFINENEVVKYSYFILELERKNVLRNISSFVFRVKKDDKILDEKNYCFDENSLCSYYFFESKHFTCLSAGLYILEVELKFADNSSKSYFHLQNIFNSIDIEQGKTTIATMFHLNGDIYTARK